MRELRPQNRDRLRRDRFAAEEVEFLQTTRAGERRELRVAKRGAAREVEHFEGRELRQRRERRRAEARFRKIDLARRRLRAWVQRADRRIEMRPFYWACDEMRCTLSTRLHLEIYTDAVQLLRQALPYAASDRERGLIQRRIARCLAMAGDLLAAVEAYQAFVEFTRSEEAIAAGHPELSALFGSPEFRARHATWMENIRVATVEELAELDFERAPR